MAAPDYFWALLEGSPSNMKNKSPTWDILWLVTVGAPVPRPSVDKMDKMSTVRNTLKGCFSQQHTNREELAKAAPAYCDSRTVDTIARQRRKENTTTSTPHTPTPQATCFPRNIPLIEQQNQSTSSQSSPSPSPSPSPSTHSGKQVSVSG